MSVTPYGYMTLNGIDSCEPTSLCTWTDIMNQTGPIPYCVKHSGPDEQEMCDSLASNTNETLHGCYYDKTCAGQYLPGAPTVVLPPLQPSPLLPFQQPTNQQPTNQQSTNQQPTNQQPHNRRVTVNIDTWWIILLLCVIGLVLVVMVGYVLSSFIQKKPVAQPLTPESS